MGSSSQRVGDALKEEEAREADANWKFPGRQLDDVHLLQDQSKIEQGDPSSEVLNPDHLTVPTEVQVQLPSQARKTPTYLELLLSEEEFGLDTVFPEGINSYCSRKMNLEGNTAQEIVGLKLQGQTSHHRNTVLVSSAGSGSKFSGAPDKVQQHSQTALSRQYSYFAQREYDLAKYAHLAAMQKACVRAWIEPDQNSHSGDSPADAAITALEPQSNSGLSQSQHSGGRTGNIHCSCSEVNSKSPDVQLPQPQMGSPANCGLTLIHIKGQVVAFSDESSGSRFIQQALETATTEEIIMVYEEIMPCIRTLVIDVFACNAVQKLLEYGSPFCRRKLISNLLGHVLASSLHEYGYQVIQKAFEIGDLDLKIEMAKELGSKILECAHDRYANHVAQKCLECVPPQFIQFIYRSFCGKATALSCDAYAYRVLQKALVCCDNLELYHSLMSEIVEAIDKLSADQFGNYVVQHILEHAGPMERCIVVMRFTRRVVQMSYHNFTCNVIEKCLTHGSYQDRQLVTNEILAAGGGHNFDHLVDMMLNPYANLVIQKMLVTADEWQVSVIEEVARRNLGKLMRCSHGKQVISTIQSVFTAREKMMMLLGPSLPPQ